MPEETSTASRTPESPSQARQSRQAPATQKGGNSEHREEEKPARRKNARKNSSDAGGEEKVNAIQAVVASSRFIVIAEVNGEVEVHPYWS